ncbi:hypothetical protein HJC23_003875 [Cyclotella cryptica]|uniref:PPIase cyclophilin-type domain-containing protein n=1 Tax=Cyclotella cryptica TaxID=29204 RepID=A0ABD3PQ13_9STRA|eukprot:CCRYP_013255-RA/>CCRYP_013255-RA protein AED:0.06 eAED:0.06 QI:125/1/1/1/1/1/3/57/415
MMPAINENSCEFCFIDINVDNHRSNLALTAAFVDATDSRYGFSSKDLRKLGGSELSRLSDLMSMDHEWSCKLPPNHEATAKLPPHGGRIVFRLYWDIAPLACENFATLCTNGGNSLDLSTSGKKPKSAPVGECGKELTYRNSKIHRVVPKFIIQGGDFVFGNGSGGESIYNGKKFKDERAGLGLKHDRAGILSMGNSGKNSNTSQFFITLDKTPQCDGKHVVFGEVVSGMEIIRAVESFGSSSGEPSVTIQITDCGAYTPLWTPGAGSWYDRPDSESYTGITPEFMIRPRVGILAPTKQVANKFESALREYASTLLMVADDIEGGDDVIIQAALTPLREFSLDLIVASPACAGFLASMDIPSSWIEATRKLHRESTLPCKETVFLVSKPVDSLRTILNCSWIGKRPGWVLSGSFV